MIPIFAPLKKQVKFDAEEISWELASSGVFNESVYATSGFVNGQSKWKAPGSFNAPIYKRTADVHHYNENGELVYANDTFFMNNLTYYDEHSKCESWDEERTIPLWMKHDKPWTWRDDVPYTKSIIEELPFEYVTCTRVITLKPGTAGLIHSDSGRVMNQEYYKNGNGSLTINVSHGSGNLHFIDDTNETHQVDETEYSVWHFNDAYNHCVPYVTGYRCQLRIFGKLSEPLEDLLDLDAAVFSE